MRTSVATLISGVAGVLIGGLAIGVLVIWWQVEEQPTAFRTLTLPIADRTIDSNGVLLKMSREVHARNLDPILQIESVHDSTKLASDFDQSVSLYLLLARADVSDLERYISESFAVSSRNQRDAALSIIFGRYAALDPNAALDRALALDQLTMQERSNVIRSISNEWTVGNLEEATVALENLPPQFKFSAASAVMWRSDFLSPDQRIQLAEQIGPNDGWIANTVASIRSEASKVDPRRAFYDRVQATTQTQEHYTELLGIVRHWFELEGATVLSEINDSLDNRNMRRSVLNAMIWNALATNTATPSEVLNIVSEFPNRQDAKESMQYTFRSWANLDPKQSFEASFDFDDPFINLDFRKSLLQIWATKDADGLLMETTSLKREYQDIAVLTALGQMSRNSPEKAIRIARNLDTRELQTQARDEIVGEWSHVNARAAFEWLIDDGLGVGDEDETSIIDQVFAAYLDQDFESAKEFVREYQGELRAQLSEQIATHLTYSDLEQAIDYMPSVEDETRRAWLQTELGRQLVELDPFEAISYGEQVEQGYRDGYYSRVLWKWASDDFFTLHKNLHRVPSKYQSDAAEALIGINEHNKYLSERDIRELESMVTTEELLIISSH